MRDQGDMRNYALVTGAYWADTVADGASRMLVLFYFYELGYSPLKVALLFVFYEVFGVITNLVGGFIAARFGLRTTLIGGLCTQLVALGMLAVAPASLLTVAYVMVAQALSGIAKDLTKMSSKSAVKLVVPDDAPGALYKWVAILTGLHGQRRRTPRRDHPLRRLVPVARPPSLPVGLRSFRPRGRPPLAHDAVQRHRQDAHNDPTLPRHRLARPSRPRTREREPCRIRCGSRFSQNQPCIAGQSSFSLLAM